MTNSDMKKREKSDIISIKINKRNNNNLNSRKDKSCC